MIVLVASRGRDAFSSCSSTSSSISEECLSSWSNSLTMTSCSDFTASFLVTITLLTWSFCAQKKIVYGGMWNERARTVYIFRTSKSSLRSCWRATILLTVGVGALSTIPTTDSSTAIHIHNEDGICSTINNLLIVILQLKIIMIILLD